MISVYIDENMSPQLAYGLDQFENFSNRSYKIRTIKDVFGSGAKDEEWIPKVGKEGGVVITQDYNIHRRKGQQMLMQEHGVGVFFFCPPSKAGYGYWEMVEQVVKRWQEIRKKASKAGPFAFKCTPRGGFEELY